MNNETFEDKVVLSDSREAFEIAGTHDENLNVIQKLTGCKLFFKDNEIVVSGEEEKVKQAVRAINDLQSAVKAGNRVTKRETRYAVALAAGGEHKLTSLMGDVIYVTARGKQLRPMTIGQKRYIDTIRKNDVVFGIGPAGTGKTYLAMAMAIAAYKNKEVSRIILTRPAVEAGEKLGFLPGDMQEKVDPYLRPLYDALFDILGVDGFERLKEKSVVEIAPLAYMRGRTLDDSFIILDEAQNTTPEQMKMFLTRMGFSSKVVVTGDLTQIDLPRRRFSGLEEVQAVLSGVEGVGFVYFNDQDVVRHELVQRIVKAYDRYDSLKKEEENVSGRMEK